MRDAELAVVGANVITWDQLEPRPNAIAVRDGRVVALGDADVRPLIGRKTRVLEAALVLPGFQDAHVHAPFAGHNLLRVWLNDLAGRQAYLDHIAAYASAHPDRDWIVGGGWAMEYFPGGTPRKEDLDAIVPDRPVFLFNRDVHGAWVNSKALEIFGIDHATPDPFDGRIERDPATGEPTGTLHEGVAYTANERWVPRPGPAQWQEAIRVAQTHLHSLGITGWQDAWVTQDTQEAYESLGAAGELTARVVGALWWDRHRGLEQIEELLARRAHDRVANFHPTSVKIMADGVMENYTGALLEPYCDGCGHPTANSGLSYLERELLAEAVTRLDAHEFQVHMHAIGDRAVRDCLDAVQAARAANGTADRRHHIAHLQLVHPEDLPRFAQLDVVANLQAYWAQQDAQMTELTVPFLGQPRAQWQFPFADLAQSGARLAMGSDWAVSTADPLSQLEVAITRRDPTDRDGEPFLRKQSIDAETAFRAFTQGSAYVNHDDDAGHLGLGARADLVLLDADPLHEDLLPTDAAVAHTVAGGAVVYSAPSRS